jgi:hypothetical protein
MAYNGKRVSAVYFSIFFFYVKLFVWSFYQYIVFILFFSKTSTYVAIIFLCSIYAVAVKIKGICFVLMFCKSPALEYQIFSGKPDSEMVNYSEAAFCV